MKRIKQAVYWFFFFMIMISTDLNSFFTPPDNFGFYVGAYGVELPYPLTIVANVMVITVITILTYALSHLYQRWLRDESLTISVAMTTGLLLYTLLSPVIYAIGIIFAGAVFILSVHNAIILEKDEERSVESLRYKLFIQGFVFILSTVVTLVNYIIWFIRGQEVIKYPYNYMSFITGVSYTGHTYGFTDERYGEMIYNASIITFTLNALLVFILSYYTWQRASTLIAELMNQTEIYVLKSNGKVFQYWKQDPESRSLEPNPQLIPRGLSLADQIREFTNYSNKMFDVREGGTNALNFKKLEQLGVMLQEAINPSVIIRDLHPGSNQSILLFADLELPVENIYVMNRYPVSIWNYLTPIRYLDVNPRPHTFRWKKRILHITSTELNSSLMRSKLNNFVLNHPHHVENLRIEEFDERADEIFSQKWDVLIVTLHGSLDGDGQPYFYGEEGGKCIYPEDLIQRLENNGIPLVLIASCRSITDYNVLVKPLIRSGTLMFVGSTSHVLASHLPLIILPYLESVITIKGKIKLMDVARTVRNCYSSIQKFGFSTQWSFFRTVIPRLQELRKI